MFIFIPQPIQKKIIPIPVKWIYLAQQEDKENSMEDDSDDNIEGGHSFLILSRSDSSMVLISSYILYLMLI